MNLIGIDLDGTLEDSRADMVAAARRVRAALSLPPRPDDALLPWVNAGMDRLYRACFDDYLAQGSLDDVRRAYEADYLTHVADQTCLYEGMATALSELRELGALACVTNKPEHISRVLLDGLGVGELFSTVVGGDSCAEAKPSPLMLQTAANRCGAGPGRGGDRAFMIGDTAADIQLGRAYGATTVWCAWGYVRALEEQPDLTAQRPADLPGLVARALRGPA